MTPLPKVVVLGAGGHGRVIIEALRACGREVAGCLDPRAGAAEAGVPVLGGDEWLATPAARGVEIAVGVGANPDTAPRKRLHELAASHGAAFCRVVAPGAWVSPTARLGAGAQILTGAVVHAGARIGAGAVVNTGAVVEHDASVGDHAFLSPRAVLCGAASVGELAFIGAGAIVLPGVRVGRRAVVPAGAVARRDVPDDALLAGGRARPRRNSR
jgi:UDP-perosamine 4-acetyltransferase